MVSFGVASPIRCTQMINHGHRVMKTGKSLKCDSTVQNLKEAVVVLS